MKNDFDFIKDKIDNSGVNAPAGMDEGFVMTKLDGVQPDLTADPKIIAIPKKRRTGLIAGIAAAFVAVAALSVFGIIYLTQKGTVTPQISADIPLKTFKSYDEVKAQAEKISKNSRTTYDYYEEFAAGEADGNISKKAADGTSGGSSGDSSSGSSGGSSGSYSETYKQVEGVDEADIVKTDGKYIYIVSNDGSDGIHIYSADDSPARVATIDPGNDADPQKTSEPDDELSFFVEEMFLHDGKLIVTMLVRDEDFDYSTAAKVYDVSDISKIRLADQLHQSGYYASSRIIGDNLYLISEENLDSDEFDIPLCYRGTKSEEIPIDCVYSVEDPTDNEMVIVGGYGLKDGAKDVQSSAVIGSIGDVYCNEENLYIYTTRQKYVSVDYEENTPNLPIDAYIPKNSDTIKTDIFKVSLKDGIAFTAYGQVEGWLDSRYSLDEKDGYLRVAATVEDSSYKDSNALYVLDSSLRQVGSVTGFAKDESIKAVRYVGSVAYVITYEETDPLFVIDLSDPTKPAVLGEVKIDGFSTMLVPVDENTVLGIGVYTENVKNIDMQVQNGVKLALFDVSDKMHPKVLDERSYRGCSSDVVQEPRALVCNPDRGDYLIPLNAEGETVVNDFDDEAPGYRGGALNFKVENGKIVEIDRPVVTDGDEIDRCLYVGDTIFLIANGYYTDTGVYAVKYK